MRMSKKDISMIFFFLIILAECICCVPVMAGEWDTFHGNDERTGYVEIDASSADTKITSLDNFVLQGKVMQTTLKSGGAVDGSPSVMNGRVYFGSGPHLTTGTTGDSDSWGVSRYTYSNSKWEKDWIYTEGGGVVSGITVENGLLYFGTLNGKLLCLNDQDSSPTKLWESQVLDEYGLNSTPLIHKGIAYVTTRNALYGFDAMTGTQVMAHTFADGSADSFASPALGKDGVIYASGGNGIVAVDTTTKNILWTYPADGPAGTPVYHEGYVYFETNSKLYCIHADKNLAESEERQCWSITHEKPNPTTPAVKDTMIIANGNEGLSAWNLTVPEGVDAPTKLWTCTLDSVKLKANSGKGKSISISQNSPVIGNDTAYFTANIYWTDSPQYGECDGVIISVKLDEMVTNQIIDPAGVNSVRGKDKWYAKSGTPSYTPVFTSSPAVMDGCVFVGYGCGPSVGKGNGFNAGTKIGDGLMVRDIYAASQTFLFRGTATLSQGAEMEVTGLESAIENQASVLGALATASSLGKGFTYSVQKTDGADTYTVSAIDGKTDSWTLYVGEESLGQTFANRDLSSETTVTFAYGGTDLKTATHLIEIKVIIQEASISLENTLDNTLHLPVDSTGILRGHLLDSKGELIDAVPLTWETQGSAVIHLTDQANDYVTYTTSSTPGKTKITVSATYNGKTVSQTVTVIVKAAIISDDTIETTDSYTTFHGNYARNGIAKGDGPKTNNVLWKISMSDTYNNGGELDPDGSPVVKDGKVYITAWMGGAQVNGVYCFDARTGAEIWKNTGFSSRAGITIHENYLYVGYQETKGDDTSPGGLKCLNILDGTVVGDTGVICTPNIPYVGISSTALVVGDTVWIYSMADPGSTLYGYSLDLKTQKYKISLNGPAGGVYASVSMSPDGTLYVPGGEGIYAIDSKTQEKLWYFDANAWGYDQSTKTGSWVGTPVYSNQNVYFMVSNSTVKSRDTQTNKVTYYDGILYSVDAISGKENWNVSHTADQPTAPVVTSTQVFATGTYGLTAYSASDGNKQWNHGKSGGSYRASPTLAGDIVYYGTYSGGTLYAVSTDGKEVWKFKPDTILSGYYTLFEGSPAIENGTLYVGCESACTFFAFQDLGETADLPFEIIKASTIRTGEKTVFTTNVTANNYKWNFGDGTEGYGTTVQKIWKNTGTYTVTASIGDNKKSIIITVQQAPGEFTKGRSQDAVIQSDSGIIIPEENAITLRFSNSTISGGIPEVTVAEFEVAKEISTVITLEQEHFDTPPNTKTILLKMNVTEVKHVTNKEALSNYAWLVIKLPVNEADKEKLSFWRYADGRKSPERLKAEYGSYSTGMAQYNVYIPGFSTIVATVDETTLPVVTPPSENIGGGGSGSASGSYSGLSFTPINPGTGTVSYTTNHPDWPATTFTFDRMTALGVLLASGKNVVTAERWGGVYVHSINGLSPASDSEGWMYQVNGISPGAMANSYPVQNGDKVVWYYSEDMTKPVSASKQVYAFTVSTSASVSEISGGSAAQPGQTTKPGTIASTVLPAETKQIKVTIPDGIKVEKLAIGQKITIDTAVTKLIGTISINARNIIIIQPGIQITIPLADVVYNGDVATATIRGMTAEIVPVTVPKGGYSL